MKRLILTTVALGFLCTGVNIPLSYGAESSLLLPESLKARSQMAADKKTVTIFIEEADPKRATELLNTSNNEYAKKGWVLFNIASFVDDGDFEGFFITYQKKLILL